MIFARNKKPFLIIFVFLIYLMSLLFFKGKYIEIYHKEPLSFYLSCHIQQYRYKSYVDALGKTFQGQNKHFVETVLRPLLTKTKADELCDSIDITSDHDLRAAITNYHKEFLADKVSFEELELEIENNDLMSKIKGSPNVYIWDSDFWYFSVVTATTTGYGDILPRSEEARRWVGFQIIFSTVLLGVIFAIMGIKFARITEKQRKT